MLPIWIVTSKIYTNKKHTAIFFDFANIKHFTDKTKTVLAFS